MLFAQALGFIDPRLPSGTKKKKKRQTASRCTHSLLFLTLPPEMHIFFPPRRHLTNSIWKSFLYLLIKAFVKEAEVSVVPQDVQAADSPVPGSVTVAEMKCVVAGVTA